MDSSGKGLAVSLYLVRISSFLLANAFGHLLIWSIPDVAHRTLDKLEVGHEKCDGALTEKD